MLSTIAAPAPVVVDANVWVSFFLTMDTHHTASFNWIDQHTAAGGVMISPSILLTEVAGAISRRLADPQIAMMAANTILAASWVQLVSVDQTLAWSSTNLAATLGLRGADAVYIALAEQLYLPLLSLDNEQLTKPVNIVATLRP